MREIQPLPVRVVPDDEESGLGFLLRAAHRNGLTLHALLAWLGIKSPQSIRSTDVPLLAFVSAVPQAWLSARLVLRRRVEGFMRSEWFGVEWANPLALRGSTPQYCASCLRENTICRANWELSGAFVCLRHRCLLCDQCAHCGSKVSWLRPAIDVCSCGHYLTGSSEVERADDTDIVWVEGLTDRGGGVRQHAPLLARPSWLNAMSADGVFSVIYAMGIRERPSCRIAYRAALRPPSPERVAEIIRRGLTRLNTVGTLQDSCDTETRDLVYEQGLERLVTRGTTVADRDIALGLLGWLDGVLRRRSNASGRRPRGQLDLFK